MEPQTALQLPDYLLLVLAGEGAVAELQFLAEMVEMVVFQQQVVAAVAQPILARNLVLEEMVLTELQSLLLTFNLWIITMQF
jgi:hypothetical protein